MAAALNLPTPSPQMRHERRQRLIIWMLLIVIVVLLTGFVLYTAALAYRPQSPVVVDWETGELRGEYRTSAFRTQEEMINGGMRFLDHHVSFNSSTVYRDSAVALNMMSESLRERRLRYLEEHNLLKRIENAASKSHLEYEDIKLVHAKGSFMRIEYRGDLVMTDSAGDEKRVAFHTILDLAMAEITDTNTSGVTVVDYADF